MSQSVDNLFHSFTALYENEKNIFLSIFSYPFNIVNTSI